MLFIAELIYFRLADYFNIIDQPNKRSSHTQLTLRGGGIIFLIGAWSHAVFFGINYSWFMLGLSAIALISFIDDIRSVPNRVRIVIHFIAMLLMFWQWGIIVDQPWWVILAALIICTGTINAYNFMDGINGITGGYSLAILMPLLLVNQQSVFVSESLLITIILSVAIFCFFNFRNKAKCFAGDVGAVSIAYIVLFVLGLLIVKTGDLWYFVFFAVYGVDSVLTIIHRLILRENIFKAHRKHAYQLMANELKISHIRVSGFYSILQLCISLCAIYLPINPWWYLCVVIIGLCIAYVCFKRKYYALHEEYLAKLEK